MLDLEDRRAYLQRQASTLKSSPPWADLAGYHLPPEQAVAWSRLQNETMADAVRGHAGTLRADGGAADAGRRRGAGRDAARRRPASALRAFQICTSVEGRDLDGEEFRPFWRLAATWAC